MSEKKNAEEGGREKKEMKANDICVNSINKYRNAEGKTAAVVVTYNRDDMLVKCLGALAAQSEIPIPDIIVVDNGERKDCSFGDMPEFIRAAAGEYCGLTYIKTDHNSGGAGGFNTGIKKAVEMGYEYLWLMDDDCIPEPGALKIFIDYSAKHRGEFGFLASKVIWKDGSIHRMNIQRRTLTKPVKDYMSKAVRVLMSSFVSLFVPTKVIKSVGLPISEFRIWTDDWEFTRRISRRYPCFLLNDSIVYHMTAENSGADIAADSIERIDRYKYLYRNDVYLYRREGLPGVLYEIIRLAGHTLKIIFRSKNRRLTRLRTMISATLSGFDFHPEIEYAGECRRDNKFVSVLEAFGEPISYGGEERIVSDLITHMPMDEIRADFLTPYYCNNQGIKRAVEQGGGNLYSLGKNFICASRLNVICAIKNFLRKNHYDIIHVHSGSIMMLTIYSILAERCGIKRIIVHAHVAGNPNIRHSIIRIVTSPILNNYPTDYAACSKKAGEWMLPHKRIGDIQVIKNGIDAAKFAYNEEIRNNLRAKYGIREDQIVIGCVARLEKSKNQIFLINLVADIIKKAEEKSDICGSYILMLVGDGDTRAELEVSAKDAGIGDITIFTGSVTNPEDYYQAMDIFALPTLQEGFSIASIEAQASGLPTIVSDACPSTTGLTEFIKFIPVHDRAAWVDAIYQAYGKRGNYEVEIADGGCSIDEAACRVYQLYSK